MKITDKTIHIVDIADNIDLEFLQILKSKGYYIKIFNNQEDFLIYFYENHIGFVILNIDSPSVKIFTLCSEIRIKSTVPIVIISEKTPDDNLVTAINIGCDEYIIKPVSAIELIARVNSILRRIQFEHDKICEFKYYFGDIIINLRRHEATSGEDILHLTNKEFELLLYLIDNSDAVCSRSEILSNVWGFNSNLIETRAIDDCIKRLRKKLAESKSNVKIETLRGQGFRIIVI